MSEESMNDAIPICPFCDIPAGNPYCSHTYTWISRPQCGFCHVPLGSRGCRHVWIQDGDVTLSDEEYNNLLNRLSEAESAISALEETEDVSEAVPEVDEDEDYLDAVGVAPSTITVERALFLIKVLMDERKKARANWMVADAELASATAKRDGIIIHIEEINGRIAELTNYDYDGSVS